MRFVRHDGGWLVDAQRARSPGRGAYLCSAACAVRVRKNKRYPGLAAAADQIGWGARTALCEASLARV